MSTFACAVLAVAALGVAAATAPVAFVLLWGVSCWIDPSQCSG